MAQLVDKHSMECTNSSLDLFTTPPTQTSVKSARYVTYQPVSAIGATGSIEFSIPKSGADYLDLSETLLEVTCKIVKADGTAIAADVAIAPVNNLLHSLFSQIEVTVGGKVISNPDLGYSYKAYITNLLSFGSDAKRTTLQNVLWFEDTTAQFNTKDEANVGFEARRLLSAESKEIVMIGKPHVDLFYQDKFLLNGVPIRLKLTRNSDNFCLIGAVAHKLVITKAELYVKHVNVSPSVRLGHVKALELGPAKYAFTRTELKNFSFATGTTAISNEQLVNGILPKRITLGLVRTSAFSGTVTENPFFFRHYRVNFFALTVDDKHVPVNGLRMDFANDNYSRAYQELMAATGNSGADRGLDISRVAYGRGFTLFSFNLAPEPGDECFQLAKTGNIRLNMQFAAAFPHPVTLVVFLEYDGQIQIDAARNVIPNFVQ